MKKIVILSAILLFASIQLLSAQERKESNFLPIPSFGVEVAGTAAFQEFSSPSMNRERRELNIQTSTTSHGLTNGEIEVWIVKVDGQTIIGHYFMNIGDNLKVGIGSEKCAVAMKSTSAALVNVFIGDGLY